MSETHTILAFLKFGNRDHIMDLYEKGTVYMNNLQYFKTVEDKELRGDAYEGALSFGFAEKGTIQLEGANQKFECFNIDYGEYLKTGNVYSLFSVSSYHFPNPKDFTVDKRVIEFGSHCLLIKQPGIFIEQLTNQLKKRGLVADHGFVKYYEKEPRMTSLSPFHKRTLFDYQCEFRFFVQNSNTNPIIVNIGSMHEYAEIHESNELLSLELKRST